MQTASVSSLNSSSFSQGLPKINAGNSQAAEQIKPKMNDVAAGKTGIGTESNMQKSGWNLSVDIKA
jgi:hypothetical protein